MLLNYGPWQKLDNSKSYIVKHNEPESIVMTDRWSFIVK